ncbi:MAG: class I SAM-dependent RNA methyltransferase [Pseudomonadota bacterium]
MEIFCAAKPGLEPVLAREMAALGLAPHAPVPGGVTCEGSWTTVWRANRDLRCADRVLLRLASFRAMHPAQLDKRARKLPWATWLPPGAAVTVEATSRKSRIYHAGAVKTRVAGAIEAALGAKAGGAPTHRVFARLDDDLCTLSLDTSGEPLHRRGAKTWVGKAPLRETLAAAFLAQCGYDPAEPLVDPMCGSGTILIEAAEIAAGLVPGRARRFAFETLPSFDQRAYAALPGAAPRAKAQIWGAPRAKAQIWGADRDQGAVAGAEANSARAGVAKRITLTRAPLSDLAVPAGPPGLVLTNPPYGARIGNRKTLFGLYGALGEVLRSRCRGWRLGIVTSEGGLARATGLDLTPGPPVPHGGLQIRLWQTGPI